MIGLLGRKVGMTQLFNEQGHPVPVTVLQVGPCVVTQLKTPEKDGYSAVQLGFGAKKGKRTPKPLQGHFKKAGTPPQRFVREIQTEALAGLTVGTELTADQFEVGDFVDVEGTSIGKGFQGVVKRHHFRGGPKSHGSMFGRVGGSIGASAFPSRVIKGIGMPGQMGNQRVTVQNLQIVQVDSDNHLLAVRGSVPGTEAACLVIRAALKRGKAKSWKVKKEEEEKKPSQEEPRQEKPQPEGFEQEQKNQPQAQPPKAKES